MIKRIFLIGIIILLVLSVHAYSFAAVDNQPVIELNNIKFECAAHINGGDVYLPLRAVGETLGYKIEWSEKDAIISVSKPGKNIMIDLKNNKIAANDHVYYMNGDYLMIESSTYLSTDFFSDHFGLKIHLDRQRGKVKLETINENTISIKTVKEASDTGAIEVTLQYPQIDGLYDKSVQDSLNAIFKKSADAAREEGLKNANELVGDLAGYTGRMIKCETNFDYRLKYNQNGMLSVVFINYQYAGGAHGMTVQTAHTFNLETGEEYKLKDLMISGVNYVSFISDNVRSEMDERIKEGRLPEHFLAPFEAIRDDQDFYLSNQAVVVYFQQYEYFPYAAGIQEFPVDFSALEDVLKPDFGFQAGESKLPKLSK